LGALSELRWNIVEQNNFVNCGKKYFEDEVIKFYFDIDNCMRETNPNTILFSSSIQYTEKPYDLLKNILEYNFEYIIFDLTGFACDSGKDMITIQKVPPSIYKAVYPCWFFNKEKFLSIFKNNYYLVEEFDGYLGQDIKIDNRISAKYLGFIFKKLSG
jgi:putative methyltransferase (TIGR04325 family)